jgi:hypothetical protein
VADGGSAAKARKSSRKWKNDEPKLLTLMQEKKEHAIIFIVLHRERLEYIQTVARKI